MKSEEGGCMNYQIGKSDLHLEGDVFTIAIGGLDHDTHSGFARAFREASESNARVVVITGKNQTFLDPTMYDLAWMASINTDEARHSLLEDAEQLLRALIGIRQPTIAKVWAPGAHSLGASIALACDFVVAADDATFKDPHLSGYGIPPGDGGALLWPVRIGLGRAREFLLLDRECTATEAVEMGLINRAVPAPQLDGEVDKMIQKLCSFNQIGVRLTKKWLNQYVHLYMNTVGLGTLMSEAVVFTGQGYDPTYR